MGRVLLCWIRHFASLPCLTQLHRHRLRSRMPVPLPAYGDDYDVSMDLTAELAGIIDVSEEEARLRAQAWRFEQTFEVRAEQHFGSRLVEYERKMAERTWQEVGTNRAEVTSALGAVAANNVQLVAQGNIAFEHRDRALRQTVCEEFDGYRAHLAMEMQEDIPAHVEARIADVCDFFQGSSSTRVPAGWNSMPASTVKCLQRPCARRRIASSKHAFRRSWCELDTARSTPPGCGR